MTAKAEKVWKSSNKSNRLLSYTAVEYIYMEHSFIILNTNKTKITFQWIITYFLDRQNRMDQRKMFFCLVALMTRQKTSFSVTLLSLRLTILFLKQNMTVQTCRHKKLCSMQVIFLFLIFLNLFRDIFHLISKNKENNYTKRD